MPKLPHNRTWYLKKLVEKAKRCVKERDNWTCQRCGKIVDGANCHASHILNVGAYKSLELDPSNMKVLCGMPCHLSWWHKNPLEAAEWFNEKFPDRYFYLKEIAKKKLKYLQLLWQNYTVIQNLMGQITEKNTIKLLRSC
jgi:hypothetical protein|tara:strand:+ start:712 stop:1131 length:420 start_codon:yes stop_codon:yes gene_type:complete